MPHTIRLMVGLLLLLAWAVGAPWVIQDGGGDIIALAASADQQHPYARVAAQWQYDAYGTVTAADHFLTHPPMHAGHKGLFVDRIDAATTGTTHDGDPIPDGYGGYTMTGTDPPRLAPYARTLYHVRNRNYAPHLGRWLQPDPNATGRDVLEASVYAGRGFGAASLAFGLEEMYGDGGGVYGYLRNSPLDKIDPFGLWSGGFAMDYLEVGFTVGAYAAELTATYAANQESDLDWALDWDLPDTMHTRSDSDWIQEMYEEHDFASTVNNFPIPLPIDVASSTSYYRAGSKVLSAIRIGGKVIESGAKHHWFFRTLTKWKGGTEEIMSYLPTALHRQMHTWVDRRVRGLLPGAPSIYHPGGKDVWREYMAVPGNVEKYFRALRQATLEFLKGKVDDIREVERILDEAGLAP